MFNKVAFSQALLRRMLEKQALVAPLALGAGIVMGAQGLKKSREYKQGFTPGLYPNGSQG